MIFLNNYKFIHIFYITDSLYKDMAQKYMNEFNASVQLSQKADRYYDDGVR